MKVKIPNDLSWLQDDILFCMRMQPKRFIRREGLANYCGLKYNKTNDRYIRECIRLLRIDGHPIVSSSHQAGYSYDPDKIDEIIADMQSRIIDLSATIKALRRGQVKDEQMRLEIG